MATILYKIKPIPIGLLTLGILTGHPCLALEFCTEEEEGFYADKEYILREITKYTSCNLVKIGGKNLHRVFLYPLVESIKNNGYSIIFATAYLKNIDSLLPFLAIFEYRVNINDPDFTFDDKLPHILELILQNQAIFSIIFYTKNDIDVKRALGMIGDLSRYINKNIGHGETHCSIAHQGQNKDILDLVVKGERLTNCLVSLQL